MKSITTIIGLLFLFSGITRAEWLNFRGPSGSGISTESAALGGNFSKETIEWKIDLPGRGLGSPLIIGDKVFVTAATGPDQNQLHVICYSASDGAQIWERKFWTTGRTMCHKKTCVAAPTPASDGETIFALFSSNDLIALDLDGNIRWMRGLTLDYPNASNSLGLSSSPIVSGDTLILQIENDSESFAAGVDVKTGLNRWKIDRPKAANWTSPILLSIDSTEIAALQSSKGVIGVHPATGSKIFDYNFGSSTIPSSVAGGDILYIPSNGLTAVKATSDGAEPKKIWNEGAQRPATASPILVGQKIYTINGAGVLTCANASSGERLWRARLKGPFSSSPVAAGNFLYIFNEEGIAQCVDLSGEEGKIVSELELGETILATPSLAKDALYIRSDNGLWKLKP
ncbi:MAG: PQQ-binding-like beta-propeller repeat protein [Verrucomicrobiales bacterium]|nr:PQQ-binding-like beta-propeller repeat protein [Verrucomicrobiales bacterium]